MKKLLFLFMLLPFVILLAQVEFMDDNVGRQFNPKFYIDFVNYSQAKFLADSDTNNYSDDAKTLVSSLIQVPYASIQFKRNSKGYFAKYSVVLTIYDESKEKIIVEKMWNERVFTKNYKQTFSVNSVNISNRFFKLEPNTYNAVCTIEDKNSTNPITFSAKIKVRKFVKPVEISDIVFVKSRVKTKRGSSIVPNVSRKISNKNEALDIYYEIYSKNVRTIKADYIITDISRGTTSNIIKTINLKAGKNIINVVLNNEKLNIGKYELVIKLDDENGSILTGIKNKFSVTVPNIPVNVENLDEAIEQLKYIASSSAIDSMQEARSFDSKLKLFLRFWKYRDPDPSTIENEVMDEYYRRVEFSKINFKSYNDGWNTDRGMIYIILGPPDQVERNPVAIDVKPYEIWQYYEINKQFVFQDETGFGDYRLLNQQYGDWNRYRQ